MAATEPSAFDIPDNLEDDPGYHGSDAASEVASNVSCSTTQSVYQILEDSDMEEVASSSSSTSTTQSVYVILEDRDSEEASTSTANSGRKRKADEANLINIAQKRRNVRQSYGNVQPDPADSDNFDDSEDDPDYHGSDAASEVVSNVSSSTSSTQSVYNILDDSDTDTDTEEASTSTANVGGRRRAKPAKWKKNIAKKRRNKGKSYWSNAKDQKHIPARSVGPACTDKCKLRCSERIRQELREDLFRSFWAMGSLQSQREYLGKLIDENEPEYRYLKEGSNRSLNHSFCFIVGEDRVRVCKTFFIATLGINNRAIRTVIEKNISGIIEKDMRGRFKKPSTSNAKQGIREHINGIPRIESHYLRAHTTREFIDGGRTISGLHRDYVADCVEKNIKYGSRSSYTQIFKNEFNISFFTPKKDQCDNCQSYNNASGAEKEALTEKYETHLKEKDLSREEKTHDKELSATNINSVVALYDLEAILPAPRGEASSFYYCSNVNSFNLTICDISLDLVDCFLWHEGEGKRGANEIGSCVYKYLQVLAESKNSQELEVTFYSDNCAGQQKNKYMFGMYMYAVRVLQLKSISHKFLITGHTQNEVDSVHSVIEKAVKRTLKSGAIYVPSEYPTIIRNAKKTGKSYRVTELTHVDFYDLKKFSQQLGPNFTVTDTNRIIKLSDIKIFKVTRDEPGVAHVKTSYEQEEFYTIHVAGRQLRPLNIEKLQMSAAYTKKMDISERKKTDIRRLIKSNIIPKYYEPEYEFIFS